MTDDTMLDATVRAVLREVPLPDGLETEVALGDVLGRGERRTGSHWLLAGVAAALVLVVVVLGVVGLPGSRNTPHHPRHEVVPAGPAAPAYEGIFVRTVRGGTDRSWNGSWLFVLLPSWWSTTAGPDGNMKITPPKRARHVVVHEEAAFWVSGDRMKIGAFDQNACKGLPVGTYRWSMADYRLTLVPVREACPQRRHVFTGSWTQIGSQRD